MGPQNQSPAWCPREAPVPYSSMQLRTISFRSLRMFHVTRLLSDGAGLGTPARVVLESGHSKGGSSWWPGMAGLPD